MCKNKIDLAYKNKIESKGVEAYASIIHEMGLTFFGEHLLEAVNFSIDGGRHVKLIDFIIL